MRIIIPMAGRGKRLRPHTLVTPKPLLPIAGKAIAQRLVEDLINMLDRKVEEIAFVIGDFGPQVEADLKAVAENLGAKGAIYHQEEALGTAHAIYCAEPALTGEVVIGFADTLFRADFTLDHEKDGVIWVSQVQDPSAFGVVEMDSQGVITNLVEKPETFVSDKAIIGIYYLKDGDALKQEIKYLLDNDIKSKGEYQLTDALANLKDKGKRFVPGVVSDWLDCGNKDNVLDTNARVLQTFEGAALMAQSAQVENSLVLHPCYIGENAVLQNCVVGPNVSVGSNAHIKDSVVKDSILRDRANVSDAVLNRSIIGEDASLVHKPLEINLGDFSAG